MPNLNEFDDELLAKLRGDWIGRTTTRSQVLSRVQSDCLAATLNMAPSQRPAKTLPALWHWIYFPDNAMSNALADDGSPRIQDSLPPIQAEQIMWAGLDVELNAPLRLDELTRLTSTVEKIEAKKGSRGTMVFVTVQHRYEQAEVVMLTERLTAVFLGPAIPSSFEPARPSSLHAESTSIRSRPWQVNEAVLFRYSALTFNTHRIHYDLPYAQGIGGYPGLVVHGPLQALLLAETLREHHPSFECRQMTFRAHAPVFCTGEVTVMDEGVHDGSAKLWTASASGSPAMEGRFIG